MTTAFLDLIVKKTREAVIPAIAKEFIAQYRQLHNLEYAEVITASALTGLLAAAVHDFILTPFDSKYN